MGKAKNSRKYSIIAAICYAALFAINLIDIIFNVAYSREYAPFEEVVKAIDILTMTGLAIFVFIERKIAVAAALGVYASVWMYYLIGYFCITNFLLFIAPAAVFVTTIIAIQKKAIINKIWFIGGIAMSLSMVIDLIERAGYFEDIEYYVEYSDFAFLLWALYVCPILEYIFDAIGLLFIGLWLKESEFPSTMISANANNCNTVNANNSNAVNAAPAAASIDFGAVSGADRLKMYKDLLDSGAITQEEFDAKKKEILEK